MKALHRLLIVAIFITGASLVAPEASAQGFSISIGDRPYYTRGPSYWEDGAEYYWVPGRWSGSHRWIRGHYVRRGRVHEPSVGFSIAIGDRPYYTRGPWYWDGGVRYYWVPGHWNRHHRWVRGHYAPR